MVPKVMVYIDSTVISGPGETDVGPMSEYAMDKEWVVEQ